jgi:hypothetical protein
MQPNTLTALAGVLLWDPDGLAASEPQPARDCLLLAWLAAQKAAAAAPTVNRLTGVLGHLGWTLSGGETTPTTLTLARLSDELWAAALPGEGPRLAERVRGSDPATRRVLDAWWKHAGDAAAPTLVIARVRAGGVVDLASVRVSLDARVYLDTPTTITASLERARLTLNPDLYAQVSDEVARQLASRLDLIVSA